MREKELRQLHSIDGLNSIKNGYRCFDKNVSNDDLRIVTLEQWDEEYSNFDNGK
jgi:hypothetical protein